MSLDPASARDSMAKLLNDAWQAIDWPGLGLDIASPPHIEWQGRGGDTAPSISLPMASWIAVHSAMPQSSLSDDVGNKSFTASGLITIQLKGPLAPGNGFEVAERMAIIARDAYRGKETPDCIWFRNARIQEVGPDAGWFLFNTFIEFEYDEVG